MTVRWANGNDDHDALPSRRPSVQISADRLSPRSRAQDAVPANSNGISPPVSPLSARSLPCEYPGLTKSLAPTYRGRLLKEELVNGTSRFTDESAIFVGRLVKEVETQFSLLERFAKYGRIVSDLADQI